MSDEVTEHIPIGGGLLLLLLGIIINLLVSAYMIYIYIKISYIMNIGFGTQSLNLSYHILINIIFFIGSLYALYANYYYLKSFRYFMVLFLFASGILNMLPTLFCRTRNRSGVRRQRFCAASIMAAGNYMGPLPSLFRKTEANLCLR